MPGSAGGFERLIAYVCIFGILAIAAGQLGLMLSTGWHRRMSYFYTFEIGLYKVGVSHGSVGHVAMFVMEAAKMKEEWKESFNNLIQGECSLGDMMRRMCQLPRFGFDFCYVWESTRMGSIIILITNSFAILVHLVAAGFVYYYWFKKAMPVARKGMYILLFGGPLLYTLGLGLYAVLSMDLVNFPPATSSMSFSTCSMFCAMLTAFSWVPAIMMLGCAKMSREEQLFQARKDLKEAEKDAAVRCGNGMVEMSVRDKNAGLAAPQADYSGGAPHPAHVGQLPGSGQPPGSQPPPPGYGGQPLGVAYGSQPPPNSGCGGQPPGPGFGGQPLNAGYSGGNQAMARPPAVPLLSGQQQPSPPHGAPPANDRMQPPSWGPMQPPSWGATAWRPGVELAHQTATQNTTTTYETGYPQQQGPSVTPPLPLSGQQCMSATQQLGSPQCLQGQGLVSSSQGLAQGEAFSQAACTMNPGNSPSAHTAMLSSTQGLNQAHGSNYTTLR